MFLPSYFCGGRIDETTDVIRRGLGGISEITKITVRAPNSFWGSNLFPRTFGGDGDQDAASREKVEEWLDGVNPPPQTIIYQTPNHPGRRHKDYKTPHGNAAESQPQNPSRPQLNPSHVDEKQSTDSDATVTGPHKPRPQPQAGSLQPQSTNQSRMKEGQKVMEVMKSGTERKSRESKRPTNKNKKRPKSLPG